MKDEGKRQRVTGRRRCGVLPPSPFIPHPCPFSAYGAKLDSFFQIAFCADLLPRRHVATAQFAIPHSSLIILPWIILWHKIYDMSRDILPLRNVINDVDIVSRTECVPYSTKEYIKLFSSAAHFTPSPAKRSPLPAVHSALRTSHSALLPRRVIFLLDCRGRY